MRQEKTRTTFEFIMHPTDLVGEIINAIGLALDDSEWLLWKWKCGWQEFKQRKGMHWALLWMSGNIGYKGVRARVN